jgi:hypothetical protein
MAILFLSDRKFATSHSSELVADVAPSCILQQFAHLVKLKALTRWHSDLLLCLHIHNQAFHRRKWSSIDPNLFELVSRVGLSFMPLVSQRVCYEYGMPLITEVTSIFMSASMVGPPRMSHKDFTSQSFSPESLGTLEHRISPHQPWRKLGCAQARLCRRH